MPKLSPRHMTRVTFLLLLLAASACSINSWKEPAPEVQATLIKISGAYLTGLLHNNRVAITGYCSLNDVLKHNKITEQTFFTRIKVLQNTFPGAKHPLAGLKVMQVLQKENEAKVILQKANKSHGETITIELFWANSGWLVVEESITRDGGLVQKLAGV